MIAVWQLRARSGCNWATSAPSVKLEADQPTGGVDLGDQKLEGGRLNRQFVGG
jgi:hypothetical protein